MSKSHGLSGDCVYNSWKNCIRRCYWERDSRYKSYGGRGIKVCEYIRSSPRHLIELLGRRESKITLDRIDNNGNYSCGTCAECVSNEWPMNVRWATCAEQNRNYRRNRLLTINGVTMCVMDWADKMGLTHRCIMSRINRGDTGEDLIVPRKIKARSWK